MWNSKYCHTLLRIHRVIWCLLSNRHFKTLTLKFLLNAITKETMTNLQNTVKRHGISFSGSILLPIIIVTFWSSYCEIRAKPHRGLKNGQFSKNCQRPFIYRFSLVYLCVSCKRHFGVLVTRLRIIVFFYSYSAYHQNQTLELLPWNVQLTPLWRKRYPICKILSHASKLSFSFS